MNTQLICHENPLSAAKMNRDIFKMKYKSFQLRKIIRWYIFSNKTRVNKREEIFSYSFVLKHVDHWKKCSFVILYTAVVIITLAVISFIDFIIANVFVKGNWYVLRMLWNNTLILLEFILKLKALCYINTIAYYLPPRLNL